MLYYFNVHMVFKNSVCCDGNRADNYSSSSDQKLLSHNKYKVLSLATF